jgi:hypothetical protein
MNIRVAGNECLVIGNKCGVMGHDYESWEMSVESHGKLVLRVTGNECGVAGYECWVTGNECRVMGNECLFMEHECRVMGHESRAMGMSVRVAGNESWVKKMPVKSRELSAKSREMSNDCRVMGIRLESETLNSQQWCLYRTILWIWNESFRMRILHPGYRYPNPDLTLKLVPWGTLMTIA